MRKIANNSFTEGMIKDLNPLTTPDNVLTDCLNGTIITYNGNEFVLQNDMGNCKVERAKLSPGFIPMGMTYYGGIVYVASLNPETNQCEVGSFPSPERDFSTSDFENISPANFKNTDFILDTGDDSIAERDTKIQKLFEPELFQLHPGDMYVVLYTLHTPNVIDTPTQYANYISEDPKNRKLFRLKFAKISDNNNLTDIEPGEIKVIPTQPDIEDEYVFFKEPSNSTIAVELQVEQLDTFDASVVDRSLKTDANKKVGISAIGTGNSMATFEGVRVQVTQPVTQTFYLQRTSTNKRVQAILDGMTEGQNFEAVLTPFSPYCLYPKLKKDFKLTLGKYLSSGSGVNDLFRYKDFTDYMKVDFDYKFEGDSVDGIHLYVEFYDPWSDYSIVKTVDNPTYYGINSIIVELTDEPRINQFDSTTVGGTNPAKLITNPDTDYEKTLLNSTNLIRTDQVLRRNHFYIIRVSGVDKAYNDTTQLYEYKHYDFYKGMYTTDMFNTIYDAQGGLSETDNGYVGDFNQLDFDLSSIKYHNSITQSSNLDADPIITFQRPDLMTGERYYKLSPTPLDASIPYKTSKTFKNTKLYNISLALDNTDNVFGDFKTNLLSLSPPDLQNSDGVAVGPAKPTIVDTNYDGNANLSPNSISHWSVTDIGGGNYSLSADLVTSRSVFATVNATTISGRIYDEKIPLISLFKYRPNGDNPWAPLNPKANVLIGKYQLSIQREDGSIYNYPLGNGNSPNEANLLTAIQNAYPGRVYTSHLMTSNADTWSYHYPTPYQNCRDKPPFAAWKQANMLIKANGGGYYLTRDIDLNNILDFWNSMFVVNNITATINVYYPNAPAYNREILSTVTYPTINFTSNFTPDTVGGVFVKTYLSKFILHATNTYADFEPTIINNWINTRKSNSTILDGKQTIRDGFIPFIINVQHTSNPITVPSTTIDQPADSSVVDAYIAGQQQYLTDPSLNNGTRNHGDFYTTKPELYATYVSQLVIRNVLPNTQIQITGNSAVYLEANIGAKWNGTFCYSGTCKDDNVSPPLNPQFDF